MHTSFDGKVDVEFDFWGATETQYYSNDRGASEVEFQAQVEEDFVDYSLPLWKTDMSRNVRNESSPLLPRGHHYSNISPRSRLQVMAEGRRKLMEIVHSMPESSYELSLKDIVDEQQISEGAQDEMPKQRTTSDFKSEAQIIKKQKTKKTKSFSKSGNISRSRSMEKEKFLIKMFIPTSLSFKIRDNTRNGSKVLPRSSMELTDNREDKKWWFEGILFKGECKNSGKSSSTRTSSSNSSTRTSSSNSSNSSTRTSSSNSSNSSTRTSSSNSSNSSTRTSSSNSSKSRYDNMEALPSCWPFFRTKKSRRTRLEGHIF